MKPPKPIDEAAALADAASGMNAYRLKLKYGIGMTRAQKFVARAGAANGPDSESSEPYQCEGCEKQLREDEGHETTDMVMLCDECWEAHKADSADEADEDEASENTGVETGEFYHLQTTIDSGRLDWVVGSLTHDDAIAALLWLDEQTKANVVQFLLQRTLNRIIEPPQPADMEALAARIAALSRPEVPRFQPSAPEATA